MASIIGCLLSLFGTGWNNVPQQRSTRCAPTKQKSVRKKSVVAVKDKSVDGILSSEENIKKHIKMARGLVLAAWPDIVQGLIKKATNGGYQQTKILLDLCDLAHMNTSKLDERDKQQLCDVLLEGLMLSSTHPKSQMTKAVLSQEPENTGAL